jgi:sugar transferase (PEP-CTERM/EpsH1 system associated)
MHVIHHLIIGGMENGLVNLLNNLPEDRYRHVVVCIDGFSDFRQRIRRADVDVISLDRSRVGVMAVRREIYRLCRRLRPSIVHSRNLSGLDALVPSWLARVPWRVHGEHGWEMSNLNGRQWKPALLRRLHAPLVDRFITVSSDLGNFLVDRVGIARASVTTLCNGVDTDKFCPGEVPEDLGLPPGFVGPGIVRFGTVARLQAVKDQATLVAAFAKLAPGAPESRSSLRLVLVGDGVMRATLEAQVEQLGIADITFFAGATARVRDWLRVMDVFVLPSLNEGISNTMLEAMSTGLPTLVTPVGGNVELLDEGRTGLSFPAGDVRALSELMADYVKDPAQRRAHGAAARARVESLFSLKTMVGAYDRLYSELLAVAR